MNWSGSFVEWKSKWYVTEFSLRSCPLAVFEELINQFSIFKSWVLNLQILKFQIANFQIPNFQILNFQSPNFRILNPEIPNSNCEVSNYKGGVAFEASQAELATISPFFIQYGSSFDMLGASGSFEV